VASLVILGQFGVILGRCQLSGACCYLRFGSGFISSLGFGTSVAGEAVESSGFFFFELVCLFFP